jgi:hypothetical protein
MTDARHGVDDRTSIDLRSGVLPLGPEQPEGRYLSGPSLPPVNAVWSLRYPEGEGAPTLVLEPGRTPESWAGPFQVGDRVLVNGSAHGGGVAGWVVALNDEGLVLAPLRRYGYADPGPRWFPRRGVVSIGASVL